MAATLPHMFLPDDQCPPQPEKLHNRPEEATEIKELGLSIGPVVVVDGDLLERKTRILEFLDHFETNGP